MPHATPDELQRLRGWRTGLLIVVGVGQGAQYLLAPDRALASPGYRLLTPLGDTGWRAVGVLVLIYAAALIPRQTRPAGHMLGAAIFLCIMWAAALNTYWPGFSILSAGLNCGEFALWLRTRGRG